MKCRFDGKKLKHIFVDLGFSPLSNSLLKYEDLNRPEFYYPLKLFVSERTFLVQIDEFKNASEIFNQDYVYFSSYSKTWLEHAEIYVEKIVKMFDFTSNSLVIEIASNDGYLLQFFKGKDIPILGIEPSSNTAKVAEEKGITTIVDFLTEKLAKDLISQKIQGDLIVGNNVLAHVPNLNDFIKGLKLLLKNGGIITLEFPHLMQLIKNNQFDTIYHEHFSYFSFHTALLIFKTHNLEIFDVEEIPTHGGSLRIYIKHVDDQSKKISKTVDDLIEKEKNEDMLNLDFYLSFQYRANRVKNEFLNFLINQSIKNKRVIAYGAAAKGNTLLNYCGVKRDLIKFVVDRSPHKQGKYMAGSHIPIVDETRILEYKPHYIVILPWNIKDEIMEQLKYIKDWGGKFVIAVPKITIL